MRVRQFTIITDSDGDYTGTLALGSDAPFLLYKLKWVDGDLADGVDAVLSLTDAAGGVDETLLTLTNADNDAVYYPQVLVSDTADMTAATDFFTPLAVEGTLKLVVANGGDTKSGKCVVYLMDS